MAQLHEMLQPFDGPFDRLRAAHLLNRTGFGGTDSELDEAVAAGLNPTVQRLLDFPNSGAEEQDATIGMPDLSSIEGYPKSSREQREMLAGKSEEERTLIRQRMAAANREAMAETGRWWLLRMVEADHPLQEKLTLFWHGHFTTSARDERSAWLMWRQNEVLRRNAAGNFHLFVQQISRDPAMLDYLNNQQNRKQNPNENYARELMELFTLGIGHYTEQDIKEAARAFTGWGHDGDLFTFRRNQHDFEPKVFFGFQGAFDGDDIIAIILRHPQAARHIATKLWTFFAYSEPEAPIVDGLADLLRKKEYELRPVLKTIFTSRAFYSDRAIGTQIKSPIQLVVGAVRGLGIELPPVRQLSRMLQQMGQVPFYPPNVKGWPGGRDWINTSTLFVRYNTCVWLAGGGGGSPTQGGRRGIERLSGARRATIFDPEGSDDAAAVVDQWVQRLIQRPIAPDKRQTLIDALDGRPNRRENVRRMVQLIVSMPEYQLC